MIKSKLLMFGHPPPQRTFKQRSWNPPLPEECGVTHTINDGPYHYHRFFFNIQETWGLEKEKKKNREAKFSSLSWDKGIHQFAIYLPQIHKLWKFTYMQDSQNVFNYWNWITDTRAYYTVLFCVHLSISTIYLL